MTRLVLLPTLTISVLLLHCTPVEESTSSISDKNPEFTKPTEEPLASAVAQKEADETTNEESTQELKTKRFSISEDDLLAAGFKPYANESYVITEAFLEDIDEQSSTLDIKIAESLAGDGSGIQNFLLLDSIKSAGGYESYHANLDVGMIADAGGHPLHLISLLDGTKMATWAVYEKTRQSCPYYEGVTVYGSAIHNGFCKDVVVLGRSAGSGDGPYFSSTSTLSTTNIAGDILVETTQESGGEDEETEITKTQSTVLVKEGSLAVLGKKEI